MQVWISILSLSSRVISAPRYQNFLAQWILLHPSFSERSLGRDLFSMISTASFRVGGKYIASVFNGFMLEPTCICNPNFAKWSWMVWAESSISFLLWKTKARSSTKRRLKISKVCYLLTVPAPVPYVRTVHNVLYAMLWSGADGAYVRTQ